jgi:phosphoribosylformylglycinamidine cyclo-ligase
MGSSSVVSVNRHSVALHRRKRATSCTESVREFRQQTKLPKSVDLTASPDWCIVIESSCVDTARFVTRVHTRFAPMATYKDAGVDLDLGDVCSRIMFEASKRTWINRKGRIGEILAPVDDFSALRYLSISGLSGLAMSMNFDGVGTKMELAERLSTHTQSFQHHVGIAHDLFAMVCDDAVVRGAEPIAVGSILDMNRLNATLVEKLAEGMVTAAQKARVAVINGEIAELGDRVGGYGEIHYNWGAAAAWITHVDRLITGRNVTPGHAIVSLAETGFRSNGLSLVRKVFASAYGDNWHKKEYNGRNLAEIALTPSQIYTAAIVDMFGAHGYQPRASVMGVAHITGGGIPGKLGRLLRISGFGAEITDPFDPAAVMLHCQTLGAISDREAYRTWNMGNGMLVITDDPTNVIRCATEHGITAKVAGTISDSPGISIRNRGAFCTKDPTIHFEVA